tara:strand:+ start:452 stop:1450 length:999 start_codon:yes stop_codon:yes gene_type:complete
MNDLLKEAIADAKAVRETALANAKVALEEAFTPRLQSMLSAKLSEDEDMEEDMEEPAMEEDMHNPDAAPSTADNGDDLMAEPKDMPTEGEEEKMDETEDDKMDEGDYEKQDEGEDLELEAIIRELEEEMEDETNEELDSSDIGSGTGVSDDASSTHTEDPGEGDLTEEDKKDMDEEKEDMDEDISLDEIISALREEEDKEMKEEEDKDMKKEEEDKKDLEEAYNVIKFLKSKINEVNLLNAKLLFSNKLFRNYPLSESQKMKVIENFDRASNLREVKLIFSTLCESFTSTKTKRSIKESYASKPSRSTAPKKEILSEGNALAARWKKLANLK